MRSVKWLAAGLSVGWALLPTFCGRRVVVINTSPSVTPGLYVRCEKRPDVGDTVDFCIPETARSYVQHRSGEEGRSWYILKSVAAGPGDRVDTTGGMLRINGRLVAPMPPMFDYGGDVLPRWVGDRVLEGDEFFVFSDRIPNSFDSRCYGPIRRSEIDSVRRPLITW